MHYHFRSRREFDVLRDSGALLEWAEVHGNFYATPREPAELAMAEGRDMLFDIDWQGAQQLKDQLPADVVSVFILPPSMKELKARLKRRAEDQDAVIEARLWNARVEIEHWREYDYIVVNDDLDRAFHAVQCIVAAERLQARPAPGPVRVRVWTARREAGIGDLVIRAGGVRLATTGCIFTIIFEES